MSRKPPLETAERPRIVPHWDVTKVSGQAAWEQKRRLASAMRLVIERLVPSNAPEEELRRAADGLERYAEALRAHPRLKHFHGYAESANAGDVGAFFDQSPLIGLANPLAPPIAIGRSGERSAAARVTFQALRVVSGPAKNGGCPLLPVRDGVTTYCRNHFSRSSMEVRPRSSLTCSLS